ILGHGRGRYLAPSIYVGVTGKKGAPICGRNAPQDLRLRRLVSAWPIPSHENECDAGAHPSGSEDQRQRHDAGHVVLTEDRAQRDAEEYGACNETDEKPPGDGREEDAVLKESRAEDRWMLAHLPIIPGDPAPGDTSWS